MSISEEREILLSQLVDGELPVDQANQVLADVFEELAHVLDNVEAGKRLNAMLQLRRAMNPWRQQEPSRAIVALPSTAASERLSGELPSPLRRGAGGEGGSQSSWRVMSLAAAAVLGGILVAGGFFLGGRLGGERPGTTIAKQSDNAGALQEAHERHPPVIVITPEQRREIARAFALHESVAGPLSWYVADDSTIQVAPVQKGETLRQPIAIILRLVPDRSCPSDEATPPKTYVIVCRNSDATIELPQSAVAKTVRLRLLPTATGGEVSLQYAIAADGSDRGPDEAALAGRRHVDLRHTSLGQVALNDCLVNVDASAWVIQDQRGP